MAFENILFVKRLVVHISVVKIKLEKQSIEELPNLIAGAGSVHKCSKHTSGFKGSTHSE